MDGRGYKTKLQTIKSRSSVPVHGNNDGTWADESYDHPKRDDHRKHNRNYKRVYAVILALFCTTPAHAETVGGVSATASPVANSSGSVTNQAIQVLQGPYITSQYGDGISCQGSTLNITPYVTTAGNFQKPYEDYWDSPVYDMRDMDEDGAPDNPGSILYTVPTRTGQKDNYNIGVGFSATWSIPLDKEQVALCKEAAKNHNAYRAQLLANKRLDFELARLKNCGQLLKEGIHFHPQSRYAKVCADVVVQNVNHIKPHVHVIPSPSRSESPYSESAADLGAPLRTQPLRSSP